MVLCTLAPQCVQIIVLTELCPSTGSDGSCISVNVRRVTCSGKQLTVEKGKHSGEYCVHSYTVHYFLPSISIFFLKFFILCLR